MGQKQLVQTHDTNSLDPQYFIIYNLRKFFKNNR